MGDDLDGESQKRRTMSGFDAEKSLQVDERSMPRPLSRPPSISRRRRCLQKRKPWSDAEFRYTTVQVMKRRQRTVGGEGVSVP